MPWKQLSCVSLTSDSNTLDSDTFDGLKSLWIQIFFPKAVGYFRLNNVSCAVYNRKSSEDGGAWAQSLGITELRLDRNSTEQQYVNCYMDNIDGEEKMGILHTISNNSNGASTAPKRQEFVFKFTETALITQVNLLYSGSTQLGAGTKLNVFGADD